ncbi:FG-GAP-like repeat-containing protein [Imhoffiella purpurea]|uniref:Fibronectin type-III domain-containing protein n=1 Tax=Imhoffiella purpurea TaxID=1249627 RepID=W9VXH2_9GAMM|nr:FG-GAP-like repeat-containing protein [Imhoffiella purpurea]EXJ15130.1 hypothetical protein D779_1684 [Imhoffiella purpurea]
MKIHAHRPPRAIVIATAFFSTSALASEAGSIVLEWDPVNDARVNYYEIYYGTQTGDYVDPPIEIDKSQTSYTFSPPDPSQIYYFAVKASDGHLEASDFSNEITSGEFRYVLGAKAGVGEQNWIEVDNRNQEFERTLSVGAQGTLQSEGDSRIAVGDIDGDGRDEVVIGHAARNDGAPLDGVFQVLDDDFSVLTWGNVSWPEYNAANGETYPAIGDIDGDGRDEIVIGLGTGGMGMIEIFGYANGALASLGWTSVEWPDYFEAGGKTFPALGDIDGDGRADLVVGFSKIENTPGMLPGGTFVVQMGLMLEQKLNDTSLSTQGTIEGQYLRSTNSVDGNLTWGSYASLIGETRPALGDVDGDGRDEIIIGLAPAGDGLVEIFDYRSGTLVSSGLVAGIDLPEYRLVNGETRPAAGDIDLDGRDEILIGMGTGSYGIVGLVEDAEQGFVPLDEFQSYSFSEGQEDAGFWPVIKSEREHSVQNATTPAPTLGQ